MIFIYPLSFIRNFTVCNSVVRVSVLLKKGLLSVVVTDVSTT